MARRTLQEGREEEGQEIFEGTCFGFDSCPVYLWNCRVSGRNTAKTSRRSRVVSTARETRAAITKSSEKRTARRPLKRETNTVAVQNMWVIKIRTFRCFSRCNTFLIGFAWRRSPRQRKVQRERSQSNWEQGIQQEGRQEDSLFKGQEIREEDEKVEKRQNEREGQ